MGRRTTPGRTADLARAAPSLRDALPGIATFVALVGTALANGGFFPGAWTAATVAFLWLIVVAVLLGLQLELTTAELAWLGLLAAIVVWTALSISWSLNARETVFEVRRDLVYVSLVTALLDDHDTDRAPDRGDDVHDTRWRVTSWRPSCAPTSYRQNHTPGQGRFRARAHKGASRLGLRPCRSTR